MTESSVIASDNETDAPSCVAFEGVRAIARGPVEEIAPIVRAAMAQATTPVLVFDARTGEPVEIGPETPRPPAAAGAAQSAPRGPGRPKLGVVAREVTLLPRHWEWLNSQAGGASVALRRLVEDARRAHAGADRARAAQNAAYRFMTAMAGDLPGFEEATRRLFRGDGEGFREVIAYWPTDVRDLAAAMAADALQAPPHAA